MRKQSTHNLDLTPVSNPQNMIPFERHIHFPALLACIFGSFILQIGSRKPCASTGLDEEVGWEGDEGGYNSDTPDHGSSQSSCS